MDFDALVQSGGLTQLNADPSPTGQSTLGGRSYTAPTWVNDTNNLDPNYSSGSYNPNGGGGGAAQPDYSADLAYLSDQESLLRDMLGRIGGRKQDGYNNINDSYLGAKNKATTQQERAIRGFNTQQTDTEQGRDKAIGNVDTNARTLSESLRRMLGMASGSGSSAYQITAPGAVARQASINREGVMDTFGKNFRDISVARKDTESDFASLLQELSNQKKAATRDFETGIGEQEIGIQGQLADLARQRAALQGGGYEAIKAASAPYQSDISSRQSALDGLFAKYRSPVQARNLNVKNPNLRDFTTDRYGINGGNSQQQVQTSPYGNYLQPRDEEEGLLA